jgi:hypothetical protein
MRQEREVYRLASSVGRLERSGLNRRFSSCSFEVLWEGGIAPHDASSFLVALPKGNQKMLPLTGQWLVLHNNVVVENSWAPHAACSVTRRFERRAGQM